MKGVGWPFTGQSCILVVVFLSGFGTLSWRFAGSKKVEIRQYPFCITKETLEEYKNDLKDGSDILGSSLSKKYTHLMSMQTKCPTCGIGAVKNISYYRVRTNLEDSKFAIMEYLRQWIHIHIRATTPLKGLVVQANVNPYGMAYGKFDLEFACKDCKDYNSRINENDSVEGKALELGYGDTSVGKNRAAAIPCRRRTYLHVRHPNVYVFASSEGLTDFCMNYNYLDITCRQTQMLQFQLMWVPTGSSAKTGVGKTTILDHGFVDSKDGMPYPFHIDWKNQFSCHTDIFSFKMVVNGDKSHITWNEKYDKCTVATKEEFHKNWRDNENFISNKVCNEPKRSLCDYNDPDNKIPNKTHPDEVDTETCLTCTETDNEFTREAYNRLVRRSYMQRRVHGILMIMGTIFIGLISIHVSRYWKETGGGCLLVGGWLWAHMALLHASKCAIYIGLVLGICQPPRAPSFEPFDIETKRDQLINIHKIVGAVAVVIFHVNCIMGPWRPSSPGTRFIMVLVHAILGYLSVLISLLAVLFSTCCFDVITITLAVTFVSLVLWIVAMVLQVLIDSGEKLSPGRGYFPVIEAVKVPLTQPMIRVRIVLLAILVTTVVFGIIFLCAKGGYKGILFADACVNCIWKYDETTVKERVNRTKTLVEPMWVSHKCELKNGTWDKLLSIP